ncbi:MAG: hypothetical protein ABI175_00670, partial [Polyangiales bacterium]
MRLLVSLTFGSFALGLVACTGPKQCDPVGCGGSVTYSTTVTFPDRKGDFSLAICRNAKCATTAFTSPSDASQTVPIVAPFAGDLVVTGASSTPATWKLTLQGGEASFAQGDVWELTFVDVTRGTTLLHVTSTPTSYTLDEPAG